MERLTVLDDMYITVIQEEDRTENANEWGILDAHLQKLLTAIVSLVNKQQGDITVVVEHGQVKMFCT